MLTHILKSVYRYIHIFINTQHVWIYHCELDREGEVKIYPTLLLQLCTLVAPLHLILCSYCGRRDPAYPGTSLRILWTILDLSM